MKRKVLSALAIAALILLGACGPGNNFRDVEGADSQDPDLVEVFNNADKHPNIVKVCIDGVAFATTSRDYNAIMRVEAWDATCPRD